MMNTFEWPFGRTLLSGEVGSRQKKLHQPNSQEGSQGWPGASHPGDEISGRPHSQAPSFNNKPLLLWRP